MDTSEFVAMVRKRVCAAAVRDTIANLEHPPGRKPPQDLVTASRWFKGLEAEERSLVAGIVERSVENSIFGLFSILDGIRAAEDSAEKGTFELRYVKGGVESLISPSDLYLHEAFK